MAVISEIKIKQLPDEYQEVEYIESTGTQWINTNKSLSSYNFLVKADVMFTSLSLEHDFIGNLGDDKTNSFVVGWYHTGKGFCYKSNTVNAEQFPIEQNRRYNITATYNGTIKTITNGTRTIQALDNTGISSHPIYVFCRGKLAENRPFIGRIYSLKVVDNGVNILNLIPCYRKSDNVAGMYNLADGVFYTNSGTGQFIVGSEKYVTKYKNETIREIVHDGNIIEGLPADKYHFARQNEFVALPSDYQQVEYIETTDHKAYIDTGVAGSLDIDFELSFQNMVASTGAGDTSTYILQASSGVQLIRVYSRDSFNKVVPIYIIQDARNHLEITAGYSSSKLTIKKSEKNFYANGVLKGITSFDIPEMASNFYYCSHPNDKNNNNAVYRHWGLKMWSDGELIRNYIPCYRKEDKVVGWFDLVGGTFNKSLGTSEFVAGADVNIELDNAVNEPIIDMQIKGNSIQAKLPIEYQQVEYIQNKGTQGILQYIDTGVKTNTDNSFEVKAQLESAGETSQVIFGGRQDSASWNSHANALSLIKSSGKIAYYYGNYSNTVGDWDYDTHVYKTEKGKLYIDDKLKITVSGQTINDENNICLFAMNTKGVADYGGGSLKIYYFKIWNNDFLLRDFIPCYRKSDNVAGMYDLVSGVFYTNQGADDFLIGGKIIPTPETSIKIESVGDYDEETGKYKVPITINETTTNIYLNEPLRKIGDYADYIDYKNKKVVRKIASEFIETVSSMSSSATQYRRFFSPINHNPYLTYSSVYDKTDLSTGYAISNKFKQSTYVYGVLGAHPNLIQSYITTGGAYRCAYTFGDTSVQTVEDAQSLIGDGFEVCYIMDGTIEETIELPQISTYDGTNTFDIETTIKPSEIKINYWKQI